MLQSTSEYEERNFDDIQRALDIEHTVKALESQLCYDQHSPEEVARQILKAACKFYDADWCGLIVEKFFLLLTGSIGLFSLRQSIILLMLAP